MISARLRRLGAALLAFALLGLMASGSVTAQTASITISVPNCSSFSLSGDAPNQTLVCVAGGAPNCTVNGPANAVIGSPITLTANCAATSWLWSGGSCQGRTTQSCTATESSAGTVNYTVRGTNASGTGPVSPSYPVSWGTTGTPALANCRFGSPPGPATVGVGFPVTVVCDNGPPTNAATFTWHVYCAGCAETSSQTNTGSKTVTLPTVGTWYLWVGVAAAGNNGTGQTPTAAIQVNSGDGGGGGGAGAVSCESQGFSKTEFYDWDWSNSSILIYTGTNKNGGMNPQGPIGPNGIVVIAFTPTQASFGAGGTLSIAGFPGDVNGTIRTTSISTRPCDLSPPFPWTRTAYDASTAFTVGSYLPDLYANLVAGTRYYINITSRDAQGNSTCASAGRVCDMVIEANRP